MRFTFICFLLLTLTGFGQDPALDSLQSALSEVSTSKERVSILHEIHVRSQGKIDDDQRFMNLQSALQMTIDDNLDSLRAETLYMLSSHGLMKGDIRMAEKYLKYLLACCKQGGIRKKVCVLGHLQMCSALRKQGKVNDATQFAYDGLAMAKEIQDSSVWASAENLIGILFYIRDDTANAFVHMREALSLSQGSSEKRRSELKANLAIMYKRAGDFDNSLKLFREAMVFMQQNQNDYQLAVTYLNVADLYLKMEDRPKAENFYQKSIMHAKDGGFLLQLAETYVNYANFLSMEGKIKEAEELVLAAEEICTQAAYNEILVTVYDVLKAIYQQQGKWQKAYEYGEKHAKLATEINKQKFEDKLSKIELETNNQIQEEKIRALNRGKELDAVKIAKQDQLILLGTIGGLVVTVLLVLVLVGFWNKRKTNKLLAVKNREVEAKNKEILDSIQYARNIQESLLPGEDLAAGIGINGMVFYKPRDIVSGDFYWYHKVAGGVVVAVVDCTGHGVPGALMSMLGHSGLSAAVTDGGLSEPGAILEFLSNYVVSALDQEQGGALSKDGMDMSLCFISDDKRKLKFAGANNSGLLIKDDELIILPPTKRPIGYYINSDPFQTLEYDLSPGDKVYMFSDGFPDQFGGAKGKKLKLANFRTMIKEVAGRPLSEQASALGQNFDEWKGALEQLDDVCVLGLAV